MRRRERGVRTHHAAIGGSGSCGVLLLLNLLVYFICRREREKEGKGGRERERKGGRVKEIKREGEGERE